MSYTDIDRVNGRTIRKLHSPDKTKTFGFLSGIKNERNDLTDRKSHENLTEAREYCGFKHDEKHLEKLALANMPKMANAQNKPGFRADAAGSRKG